MSATAPHTERGRRRWALRARRRQAEGRKPAVAIDVPPASVPDGWFCFRDVDLGAENAPLIVAGVRGVFTVDAYLSRGAVSVGKPGLVIAGRSGAHLVTDARRRAGVLGAAIGTTVRPLIAFEAYSLDEGWIEDVHVIGLSSLRTMLVNVESRRSSWDELKRVRAALTDRAA